MEFVAILVVELANNALHPTLHLEYAKTHLSAPTRCVSVASSVLVLDAVRLATTGAKAVPIAVVVSLAIARIQCVVNHPAVGNARCARALLSMAHVTLLKSGLIPETSAELELATGNVSAPRWQLMGSIVPSMEIASRVTVGMVFAAIPRVQAVFAPIVPVELVDLTRV